MLGLFKGGALNKAMLGPVLKQIKAGMLSAKLKSIFIYIDKDEKIAMRSFEELHYVVDEKIMALLPEEIQNKIKEYNGHERK